MLIDHKGRRVHITRREATDSQLSVLREVLEPEEPLHKSGFFQLSARARFVSYAQKDSAFHNKFM